MTMLCKIIYHLAQNNVERNIPWIQNLTLSLSSIVNPFLCVVLYMINHHKSCTEQFSFFIIFLRLK